MAALTFARRGTYSRTDAGTHITFKSKCGEFAVIMVQPKGYRAEWLAVQCLASGGQVPLGRRSSRDQAEDVCNAFLES